MTPAVSAVTSAFYGGTPQMLRKVIPGEWATVWGQDLASAVTACPLAATCGTVQVLVDGAPSTLAMVAPGQINFQISSRLALGQHKIAVTRADMGRTSAELPLDLVTSAPVFATFADAGNTLRVLAQRNGSTDVVTAATPPKPGDILTFYVLGMSPPVTLQSTIGGQNARVLYAGPTSFSGLYQINIEIPANYVGGASLPDLTFKIGDDQLLFPRFTVPGQ